MSEDVTGAVCSLWHCPAGHPGSLLTTTLLCGARTFLGGGVSPADATAQPTRPSYLHPKEVRGVDAAGHLFEPLRSARDHGGRRMTVHRAVPVLGLLALCATGRSTGDTRAEGVAATCNSAVQGELRLTDADPGLTSAFTVTGDDAGRHVEGQLASPGARHRHLQLQGRPGRERPTPGAPRHRPHRGARALRRFSPRTGGSRLVRRASSRAAITARRSGRSISRRRPG